MTKLRVVNARTAEQWAEIILSKWQNGVGSIMETGLSLSNSKEELEPAEFWQMVNERLRFAKTTAEQLIRIGTNPRLLETDVSILAGALGYALRSDA